MRQIQTRYEGICRACRKPIAIGENAFWEEGKGIWHLDCDRIGITQTSMTTGFPARLSSRKTQVTLVLVVVIVVSAAVATFPYLWKPDRQLLDSPRVTPPTTIAVNPTSSNLLFTSTTTSPLKAKWLGSETNVISWTQAASYAGQFKIVEGTIVYTRATSGAVFLDFHVPYQGYFYAVIFTSSLKNFPFSPASFYYGKEVRISGSIQIYRGDPEIIVNAPSQIEVAYMGFNYP